MCEYKGISGYRRSPVRRENLACPLSRTQYYPYNKSGAKNTKHKAQ